MFAETVQVYPEVDPTEVIITSGNDRGPYRFGDYLARPSSRDLICRGQPVDVGSRAFDLLIILLRFQGEIVSKDDIFDYVWPSTTVDESNLRFQMATLRKILGSERDRIKTIPGRGYLFAADYRAQLPPRAAEIMHDPRRAEQSEIVIINQDPETRAALQSLLRPIHALVWSFGSMEAFLDSHAVRHE